MYTIAILMDDAGVSAADKKKQFLVHGFESHNVH